jgi:pimeloyl-ACP methyl ester carboxylesterase
MAAPTIFLICAISISSPVANSVYPARANVNDNSVDELKRGAFFGAKIGPVSTEVRERLKLGAEPGIMIEQVIKGSTADGAGFQSGDVLLSLNGAKIAGASEFVRAIGGSKADTSIAIAFRRGDAVRTENVKLKARPLETSDSYDVSYGSVPSRAGRLRTIVTRPRKEGKHPALFLIQGIGVFSIDNPSGALGGYKAIIDDFTRRGFVTLRVDKPGCGDSEGGPARDVDFDTELDGYRQALKMLKGRSDVDASKIFIFGHSMGGVMAPLLSAENPVHGIIAFGTISRTWTEYMLENLRRQLELGGAAPAEIDRVLRAEAALLTYLYSEKLSPKMIAERYPHLRERLAQTVTEETYFFDRSLRFFGQLADKNLAEAWQAFDGHALAIWGKGDYVSNEDDHALIARIVNRYHPGHGTFRALEGIDHGLNRSTSRQESFNASQAGQAKTFNPTFLELCHAWIKEISASPASTTKPSS